MAAHGSRVEIATDECCAVVLATALLSTAVRFSAPGTIQTVKATTTVFGLSCLPHKNSLFPPHSIFSKGGWGDSHATIAPMKTDSIFYRLFQEYPAAFFEVLGQPGEVAQNYTFTSVEVKQTAFRLDGVFESRTPELPTYFIEVQFQEDRRFYDRALPEIILYLAQNERVTNWHFVIWVARPSLLPALPVKYQLLSANITLVSLNRLSEVTSKPLGVQLIDLIVCPVQQAPTRVSELRTRLQSVTEPNRQRRLVDLMETVLVYKFDKLSRKEIEAMFGLSELKQTRVYQEAKEEGVQIGRQEGVQIGRQEGVQIGRQEGVQIGRQEGRQEGVQLGEAKLLIRQLSRRFGKLSPSQQERITALPLEELERLGEALLDWQSSEDLPDWLRPA